MYSVQCSVNDNPHFISILYLCLSNIASNERRWYTCNIISLCLILYWSMDKKTALVHHQTAYWLEQTGSWFSEHVFNNLSDMQNNAIQEQIYIFYSMEYDCGSNHGIFKFLTRLNGQIIQIVVNVINTKSNIYHCHVEILTPWSEYYFRKSCS